MSDVLRPSVGRVQAIGIACCLLLSMLLMLSACGGSNDGAPSVPAVPSVPDVSTPGIVDLDDADLLIEDLRTDPEIRAELSAELSDQLGIPAADADCLADRIDVEDLLAMSATGSSDTGGDDDSGALDRILEAFDACDVPRSVFDQ